VKKVCKWGDMVLSDEAALDLAIAKAALVLTSGMGIMVYLIRVAAKICFRRPDEMGVSSHHPNMAKLRNQEASGRFGETTPSTDDLQKLTVLSFISPRIGSLRQRRRSQ